ncbi:ankyrin repeat-containing domain protein [Xylaria grammica]|nr:ankyrin repeat-containing domain protein [Xylaria grammica]
MEAFGLGANVAAFVVIAAQLSKVLYTTFSSIKDGPDNARKVAAHLLQLHGVLEQLRHSSLASKDTALVGHVGLCVSDLNSLADDVQKLQLTPDEARTGRLWKRFKSFLDEKKLDRICDQIVAHTSTLSLRLSIVNSNTTYEMMSGTRATNQLINDLSGNIVEQTGGLVSKFGDVESTLHTQHDKLQKGLTSIQAAVSDVSHMSQTKADSMLELLLEIKNSIVNPNPSTCQRKTVADNALEQRNQSNNEEVEADTTDKPSLNADLVRSITRLCRLIKEKDQSFDTNEEDNTQAEDIIEDLQTLVGSAQRYGNTASSIIKKGATNKRDLRSDLRRFSQSFGQFKLLINEENRREDGPSPTAIQQKRTYTRVFLKGLGTLSLMVTKKTGASSAGEESSTMVLSFLPEDLQQFTMIVASTTQRKMPSGPAPPISRLAVNRVLPAGSRVFNVVEKGLLQELQAMLQNNEATLRDHDEYGASLLFYAIYGQKTEMCRFLLENGADIDHVASTRGLAWGRTDDPRFALDIYSMTDYVNHSHLEHNCRSSCGRLLLDWGADPTAHMPGTTSFFEFAINCGRHEAIRFVYSSKLIKAFVGTDNSVPDKTQSLFNACTAFNYGDIAERIRKFLDAGANVNLRNGKGQSCLHVCLQHARLHVRDSRYLIRSQFRAIKLLIERGADVYAVDLSGKSVSELAYVGMNGYHLGDGFVGDLWDAVLHDCGYDIAIFRKNHQRKPSYGGHYSRKHLEMLWEGKGDQCPYWNDAVWPPDAASHPPLEGREAEDNNERAKDILSSDEPGESPGSFCLEKMDGDGVSMRNGWCWRGQSALQTAEEIDSHAIPEFLEAETEPAPPIQWHVNGEGTPTGKQGRGAVENMECLGLFENPWI